MIRLGRIYKKPFMYDTNFLAQHLRAASLGRDNSTFIRLHETDNTISFQDFFQNAERIASVLINSGIQPGDRVAVQVEKSVSALELYMGTVLAGSIFLPLNPAYTPAEIEYFLCDARPALFVCDPSKIEMLTTVAETCGVTQVWTLTDENTGSLVEARNSESPGFRGIERGPDDLAAILYTSGTTGRSKGAMLTHRCLHSNAEALVDTWRFGANDVLIHALPIFHTHGLFVATNVSLLSGSSMIFMHKFDTDGICQRMTEASVLMGVPTFFHRLLQNQELEQASKNMRLFVSGSAPLLAQTHVLWRERTGHAILERYGMTETNMNTSNPYDGERRAGTVGFPLPGVEVIVTNPENGQILPSGEIGVLEVRGPNVFKGYWEMPEKTSEELRENGFFITGDLGTISEDGYVSIVGRSKDLIISGGYNIYPKEIEVLLDGLDGVLESALIGIPHPDFGEGVVAVIVPQSGAKLIQEDIMLKLKDQIARFKHPKRIVFIDELPRNTMGKVQKKDLRERFARLF